MGIPDKEVVSIVVQDDMTLVAAEDDPAGRQGEARGGDTFGWLSTWEEEAGVGAE